MRAELRTGRSVRGAYDLRIAHRKCGKDLDAQLPQWSHDQCLSCVGLVSPQPKKHANVRPNIAVMMLMLMMFTVTYEAREVDCGSAVSRFFELQVFSWFTSLDSFVQPCVVLDTVCGQRDCFASFGISKNQCRKSFPSCIVPQERFRQQIIQDIGDVHVSQQPLKL